jgi:hypothetical protein
MNRSSLPGPDIPALVVISLILLWLPPAVELVSRWAVDVAPVRIVFLGW